MSTVNQILRKKKEKKKEVILFPQKKGVCTRLFIKTPKKPNSAKRKVARVFLNSLKKTITVYIPGEGHNLQKFSAILVRPGRVQDLPGVRFKAIRGVFDLAGIAFRFTARSKYGTPSWSRQNF